MNLTVEKQRYLKKWAKNFLLYLAIAAAGILGLVAWAAALFFVGKMLGPFGVFGFVLIVIGVVGSATMSALAAKEEIRREDREAERTMEILKRESLKREPR